MDCAVLAGGKPAPDDPLYVYSRGKPKAYIDMQGKSMLERVVDGLEASQYVEDVVVIGLDEEDWGLFNFSRPVHFLADQGSLVGNARAGLQWCISNNPEAEQILLCSVDIPLITGEIIDEHVNSCRPFDKLGYYTFVTRETMEARFPHSNRTFVKLKGLEVAGGDLAVVASRLVETDDALWDALTNARKHAWKLARIVGLRFLLKFLLRRLTVADIEEVSGRLLGERAAILLSPHAELAMDADKPDQIELLRQELK